MKAKVNKVHIHIIESNMLDLSVDTLVVATDTNLTLSPALAEKGGEGLRKAVAEVGWCGVGSAVATSAGSLPFDHIIHAVGPRWGEGSERGKLLKVVFRCLQLAEENGAKSLAFPPISVGTMGFPLESCARIMLNEIIDYTFEDLRALRKVIIYLPDSLTLDVFKSEFMRLIDRLQESGEGKVRAWSGA